MRGLQEVGGPWEVRGLQEVGGLQEMEVPWELRGLQEVGVLQEISGNRQLNFWNREDCHSWVGVASGCGLEQGPLKSALL